MKKGYGIGSQKVYSTNYVEFMEIEDRIHKKLIAELQDEKKEIKKYIDNKFKEIKKYIDNKFKELNISGSVKQEIKDITISELINQKVQQATDEAKINIFEEIINDNKRLRKAIKGLNDD